MQPITVPTRCLFAGLLAVAAIELALCYAHAAYAMVYGIALRAAPAPWLNIDGEASLNAWFTSSLLLITALLMLWAFAAERAAGRRTMFGWLLLTVGFFNLSLDEMTVIHEKLANLTTSLKTIWPVFTHRWVIIGVPIVIIVGITFLPFLLRLPRKTAVRLLSAGMIYVGGALGLELLNGAVKAA